MLKPGRGCSAWMDVFVAAFRGRLEEGEDLVSLWRVRVEPATLSDHWRVTEASREVCVTLRGRQIIAEVPR